MKLTIREYALKCGVSTVVIRKRIAKGEIKTIKLSFGGKQVMFIDTEKYTPIGAKLPGAPKLYAR